LERRIEINSSFYRPHRASTYARWAASVPSWCIFDNTAAGAAAADALKVSDAL